MFYSNIIYFLCFFKVFRHHSSFIDKNHNNSCFSLIAEIIA